MIDITNQNFGRLIALRPSTKRSSHGEIYWICQCSCGNIKEILGRNLRKGLTTSCGCLQKEKARELIKKQHKNNNMKHSLINKKFGKLLVLEDTLKRTSQRRIIYKCKCDCGNYCEVSSGCLSSGDTISCRMFKTEQG